jgi:DNA-directed RNA polymerase subunit RPC12/RpoP
MSGVIDLFICADCRDVVSAQTWNVGYGGHEPQGDVTPTCPRCGRRTLHRWGEGVPPAGPCPRCGQAVETESIGIAD